MNGLNRILLAAVSALIACIGTLGVTVPSARADLINYSFTKIADTNTLVPGGSGNFTNLGSLPSIDGGTVVFNGDGNSTNAGLDGIYSTMGGLHVVADTNTAIPGGSGNFINFQGHASLDGGTLHFTGVGGGNQYGIYRGTDGASLQTIVDINTAIPGGNGNFTEFGSVSAETNSVAFIGYRDFPAQSGNITDQGVYLAESGGGLATGAPRPLSRACATTASSRPW